jgi:DNA-binding ferritin-like protein (Dps family)
VAKTYIDKQEYRKILRDMFEAVELVDRLDITIDEVLDAFEEAWMEDEELYDEVYGDMDDYEYLEIDEDEFDDDE